MTTTARKIRRPLLTVAEVADKLRLTPETVWIAYRAGKLRGFQLSRKTLRFDPDELDEDLANLRGGGL